MFSWQLLACVSHPDNWEQRLPKISRIDNLRVKAVALSVSAAGDSTVNVGFGRGSV